MSDRWHVVIDAATGEAVSIGTRVASPLRPGLAAIELSDADAAAIREGRGVWVAAARAVAAIPEPVPEAVTPWQFFTWLLRHRGVTPAAVESLLASLPEPQQSQARIDVNRAHEFRRAHPLVVQFFASLGATDGEADDAFREMSRLTS